VVVISPGKPVDTARETSFTPIQSVRRIQGRHQFEAITVVGIDEEERTIPGDVLCFSGGRVPWMPYLKHQGLIRDERGRLKTTATGRTSVRGIWAVPPLSDVEEIVVEDLVADIMEEAAR
jgi:thioredoxin reductase